MCYWGQCFDPLGSYFRRQKWQEANIIKCLTVYAGAKLLGGVVCGNQCVIAANCVCLTDVPDNAVIIGVPGKIKK